MITTPVEGINALFGTHGVVNIPARYNFPPTEDAPVVRLGPDGTRELVMLRWGLVPAWADDPSIGSRMINARGDSAADKPAFRDAFRSRRCLVAADGFYEWRSEGGRKQPWLVRLKGGGLFAFAGLWESWRPKEGGKAPPLETFSIVTTEAAPSLRDIHPRMPVIVARENHEAWLAGSLEAAASLIGPYPDEALEAFPVSPHVNSVRNDDAECARPLDPEAAPAPKSKDPAEADKRQLRLI